MELLVCAIVTAVVSVLLCYFLFRRNNRKIFSELVEKNELSNKLLKDIHRNEADYLKEKNQNKIEFYEQMDEEKRKAYASGEVAGRNLHEAEYQQKIAALEASLENEYRGKILREREAAAAEAREKQRVEMENQLKIFSVMINPYVRINTEKGIIWDDHDSIVGYQYQLMINGIPAFQPHIIIEKQEKLKEVNQENVARLENMASAAAKLVANNYAGGVPSAAIKVGNVIKTLSPVGKGK